MRHNITRALTIPIPGPWEKHHGRMLSPTIVAVQRRSAFRQSFQMAMRIVCLQKRWTKF